MRKVNRNNYLSPTKHGQNRGAIDLHLVHRCIFSLAHFLAEVVQIDFRFRMIANDAIRLVFLVEEVQGAEKTHLETYNDGD